MIKLVAPNDPILQQEAEDISRDKICSEEIQTNIEGLLSIAYGEQKDRSKPVLFGLAAPQAGISKSIILVDIGADGHGSVSNLQVFINPQITFSSEEKEEWYEACYSTDRVCGIVERPKTITLSAYDREGKELKKEYSGYVSRIFQHEIDHLHGKVFADHIKDDNDLHWVEKSEFPTYRDKEAWRIWPNKCPRERWLRIKNPENI